MKLEAKDVQCGWDKGSAVQRYVSFSVGSGEVCCILGPNGCGKTTLLKTVMGIIPRQGGLVNIDGKDVEAMSPKEIASALAFVSQGHTPPFPYRVRDVVLLGRTEKVGLGQPSARDVQIADSVLADMGILHLREQPYTDISGGELQLTMIARALAQEPQLLVMDEPASSLDYGNMVRVINKIRSLKDKGFGIIMTTHSPDQAFMCESKVALLRRREPLIFGDAAEVITQENMHSAYGVDVKVIEFFDSYGRLVRMCSPLLE